MARKLTISRTFLRLTLLLITRRPIVWPPTPQREYDVALIPQDRLLARDGKPSAAASAKKATNSAPRKTVVNMLQRAPLRSHLYPLTSALPEAYLPHPLSLVPELERPSEVLSEMLSATAVLVQVILLIRVAVS